MSSRYNTPSTNKAERLIENWSDRIDIVEEYTPEGLSYEKKLVLAQCLQNTKEAMDLMEATDSGD